MVWFRKDKTDRIDEEIKSFSTKGDKNLTPVQARNRTGEGVEDFETLQGYGAIGLSSFNIFYQNYINKHFETEIAKIKEYRNMAEMTEIADVIEDAVNESTEQNDEGKSLHLVIKDEEIKDNENVVKNINDEFDKLFYERLNINEIIWDMLRTYYIDGRYFYERIINTANQKNGIIGIKKLPTETMDYFIQPSTGKITKFIQYLSQSPKRPTSIEEAEKAKDIIVFDKNQISFVNYGIFGKSKYEIVGYLEKAKIPYNQLKLLETSVVIYRIIRAPERFVFRIDTGAMPLKKAMAFVEKIKNKMLKKQTYDATTGRLSQEPNVMSLIENFYLPQCLRLNTKIDLLDGRSLTLQKIIDEYKEGKKHEVYSVNQNTGKIIKGEVEWAGVTRKDAELMRVWFDNNKYIDVTPDHKFCVWKDESHTEIIEVEAQHLTEDMDIVENE